MKIVFQMGDQLEYDIVNWENALKSCSKYDVILWNEKERCAFDMFYEEKPDIFIASPNLSNATIKCLKNNDNCKCGLVVYHEEEINNINKDIKYITISDLLPSVNINVMANPNTNEHLKSDVVFIGNYLDNEAQYVNEYLLPLCKEKDINFKIFGMGKFPCPQHLGTIMYTNIKNMIYNSKFVISLHDKYHWNWLPFTALFLGKSILTNDVTLSRFLPQDFSFAEPDSKKFINLVKNKVKNHYEDNNHTRRKTEFIMKQHTHYHNIAQIFDMLSLKDDADYMRKLVC